ncbi:TPA: winged helix-turn-helix transcriptional regulator, partial [Candidatus Woesearchaeota archaeon]|nr:winged helix-turn-helix transcriptional regulator [Candidatus Woesearchaeota archaeon]
LLLLYNGTSNAHNYLFPEKKLIEHTKVRLASEKIELSRKEKLIIHFLTDNPRMSFNAISEKIDSTLRQVRKMYNGLVEKGVIMYIRPSLNSRKLDYLHKHIIIKMKFSAMKYLIGIKEHLVSLRTTKAVYLTLGRYDITGRFIFSNLEEFNKFKEDFYSHFGGYIDSFISDDYYEDVDYAPHRAIEMFAKEE